MRMDKFERKAAGAERRRRAQVRAFKRGQVMHL